MRLARESGWEVVPSAAGIGAANTLVITRDGEGNAANVQVLNTDALGAAECLKEAVGTLAGKSVGVVGAGGVGRAVAYGTARNGATVVIYSRNLEKAARVERDIEEALPGAKIVVAETGLLAKTCCDVLVNCTPVGMRDGPEPEGVAMPLEQMTQCDRTMVVMDTVYAPLETPLLKAARGLGFKTVDGASLFVRQAEAQFNMWAGRPAPAGLFDRLVRGQLARQNEGT
jgi:shikimate 5-dehydrogenase